MKIKDIFEEEQIGGEIVMVSLDNSILNGIVRANESAGFIISCLKEDSTVSDVEHKVCVRYGIAHDAALAAVNKVIVQLQDYNLLEI